ncbi:hypothetical protein E4U26_008345 [Claviceps purpurea]|nr:hypothetical protein E4U26_008345 [Claviceps purpurea]
MRSILQASRIIVTLFPNHRIASQLQAYLSVPTSSQQSQSYASAFDESQYGTDTAMTDAVFSDIGSSKVLKGPSKHPAVNNFDKVQAGLLCKACEIVLRNNDLERILKHLSKCPRLQSENKAAALVAYEERYGKSPAAPFKRPSSSRVSTSVSSPNAALRTTILHKWVDTLGDLEKELIDKELAMTF